MINIEETLNNIEDSNFPEKPEDLVEIKMTREDAEAISFGLSDVICWAHGFEAGRAGTDHGDSGLMSIETLRQMNIKIRDVL